jgi:excisionase family DNA binding protein
MYLRSEKKFELYNGSKMRTAIEADLAGLYGGRARLLTVADVADQLGVCGATVYRLCESGELPHVRIVNSIRIRPADLAAFLA